jgi:uncharacterized membrane protein YdjX (TVP38/TMEM64 family)
LALLFWVVLFLVAGYPLLRFVANPQAFRDWVDAHGVAGRAAFVGMVVFQIIVAIIPGEPLELAAGYAFGAWEGALLCMIGIGIGSVLVYLFVRAWGIKLVEVFFTREKIDSLAFLFRAKRFYAIAFIVFLIPGTPKDLLTYAMGLTKMRVLPWLLITCLARIPSVLSSTLGGGALGDRHYELAIIILALTILISILGISVYQWLQRKEKTGQ